MRLGVLDVGSNTVHLLVVDAHRGGHPIPTFSEKSELRLAELLRPDGALSRRGEDRLIDEEPDVALSLPLGAGRLTRERLSGDPPRGKEVAALRQHVRTALAPLGPVLVEFGAPDLSL